MTRLSSEGIESNGGCKAAFWAKKGYDTSTLKMLVLLLCQVVCSLQTARGERPSFLMLNGTVGRGSCCTFRPEIIKLCREAAHGGSVKLVIVFEEVHTHSNIVFVCNFSIPASRRRFVRTILNRLDSNASRVHRSESMDVKPRDFARK